MCIELHRWLDYSMTLYTESSFEEPYMTDVFNLYNLYLLLDK